MLTGPWYRWSTLVEPAPGVPECGRNSKPEIQKYAGFDFAREFTTEPQRSLEWTEEDYFHRTIANTKVLPATLAEIVSPANLAEALAIVAKTSTQSEAQQADFIQTRFVCFTQKADRDRIVATLVTKNSGQYISDVEARKAWLLEEIATRSSCPTPIGLWIRKDTQIRKLYKPHHARNYLVVVELHCDAAGFPSVNRREVAEAGFVVRRLRVRMNDETAKNSATAALQKIATARQDVAYLENHAVGRIKLASDRVSLRMLERPALKRQEQLLKDWSDGKIMIDELAAAGAFELQTQRWIPDPGSQTEPADPLRGQWQDLDVSAPQYEFAGEATIPLFPLIPDPRADNHSAAGRTLFFGVIPTGGREAEADGAPRFDDHHLYEIRCWVRKHPHKPGCLGELVWSEPTIGYRLAHDTDPEGAANLPISITVPSFKDLAALADRLTSPPGGSNTGALGGMRIVQPPDAVFPLVGTFPDASAGPKSGMGQICFFAIILLFIIALFLIFIFLPIIVFLFQLFFLLRLKFCIPPSISFDLDLAVELKAQLDMNFAVGASLNFAAIAAIAGPKGLDLSTEAKLSTWVDGELAKVYSGDLLDELIKAPLATRLQRIIDLRTDFRGSIDPDLAADLNFAAWGPAPPGPDTPVGKVMAPPLRTGAGKLQYYPYYNPREVFG